MPTNDVQGLIPRPDRTLPNLPFRRLRQAATELATGSTSIEELGSRLRDDIEVPPTVNLARPAVAPGDDAAADRDDDAVGPHGGIVPGP